MSSSESDYPYPGYTGGGGGPEGIYGQPSESRCCEEKICNCLADSLESIAYATAEIARILDEKLGSPCDHIDECMDAIIENLRERFERPLASCEECKTMLANGLGGTFEYVFACTGVTCDECDTQCSLGDPSSEGGCCKGCGQEPCCCKDGVCEPCGEEPDKPKKWVGWCYPQSGSIAVTEQGKPSPGEGWEQVALADSEVAAATEAAANCQRQPQHEPTREIFVPPLDAYPSIACDFNVYLGGQSPFGHSSRLSIIQQIGAEAQNNLASAELGMGGINVNNVGEVLNGAVRYFTGSGPYLAGKFIPRLIGAFGCQSDTFKNSLMALSEFQFINRAIGVDVSDFTAPWRYAANLACPTKYLNTDQAMEAYLGGSIDERSLATLWGMNGVCAEATEWARRAARTKPIPLQLAIMRRRKLIDAGEYGAGMRQLGFVEPETAENLFKITEQVPTLQDIIRLMVRDADDTAGVVAQFDLDAKFTDKYPVGGKLREWAEFQGVPEDVARYAWRAHWQIPPPTALFEFYHRLRKNPEYPDMLDDVKAALIQQDILPFWHRHYLAISFRPMGRIDIRRSYNIGALSDDEVKDAYTQLGYSDETVDSLFKFSKRLRDAAIPNSQPVKLWLKGTIDRGDARQRLLDDGFPADAIDKALSDSEAAFSTHELSKAFMRGELRRENYVARLTQLGVSNEGATRIADRLSLRIRKSAALGDFAVGLIGRADAGSEMTSYGMDTDITNAILDDAERALRQNFLAQCQRGIKRRYLLGEIDAGDARRELINRGTTHDRAVRLVDWWGCELSAIGKTVPAAKLCDWLARGAISAGEVRDRLERLGYKPQNAAMMVEDCLISINVRRLADAKKQAKEQATQSQRAQRALQRQIAQENRTVATLERQRKQAQTVRSRRERQALTAAQKILAKSGIDLYDALAFVNVQRSRVRDEYGLTVDESLIVIVKAVETCKGCQFPDLVDTIDAMAVMAVGEADRLASEVTGQTFNSNGSTHPST